MNKYINSLKYIYIYIYQYEVSIDMIYILCKESGIICIEREDYVHLMCMERGDYVHPKNSPYAKILLMSFLKK